MQEPSEVRRGGRCPAPGVEVLVNLNGDAGSHQGGSSAKATNVLITSLNLPLLLADISYFSTPEKERRYSMTKRDLPIIRCINNITEKNGLG